MNEQQQIAEMQDHIAVALERGTEALVKGFSANVDALFEKSLVISHEQNPFGELSPALQMTIVRNATQQLMGQAMAAIALITEGGKMDDKEVFSAGVVVTRRFYYDYLRTMRKERDEHNKKNSLQSVR